MVAKNNLIVGITGGSGTGKTEFLKNLLTKFGSNEVCLICQDDYYLPREQQQVDKAGYVNFDLPEAIDVSTLFEHINQLKNSEEVSYSEYSFITEESTPGSLTLKPAPIVIVEGIFIFHYPEIANLLDLKIYIDADVDVMLKRRLNRDQNERGYDMDEIEYRFNSHVIPAYEKYILPYRNKSDMVIPNNDGFDEALSVIAAFLRDKISNIKV